MEKMTVWKDRSNSVYIELSKNGTALTAEEMTTISKVELHSNDIYYGSDTYPDVFDLVTAADTGQLIIKPGLLDLTVGSEIIELIVYDDANPAGIMWMQIKATIKDDAVENE